MLTVVKVIHFWRFAFRHIYFRVDCHSTAENYGYICEYILKIIGKFIDNSPAQSQPGPETKKVATAEVTWGCRAICTTLLHLLPSFYLSICVSIHFSLFGIMLCNGMEFRQLERLFLAVYVSI